MRWPGPIGAGLSGGMLRAVSRPSRRVVARVNPRALRGLRQRSDLSGLSTGAALGPSDRHRCQAQVGGTRATQLEAEPARLEAETCSLIAETREDVGNCASGRHEGGHVAAERGPEARRDLGNCTNPSDVRDHTVALSGLDPCSPERGSHRPRRSTGRWYPASRGRQCSRDEKGKAGDLPLGLLGVQQSTTSASDPSCRPSTRRDRPRSDSAQAGNSSANRAGRTGSCPSPLARTASKSTNHDLKSARAVASRVSLTRRFSSILSSSAPRMPRCDAVRSQRRTRQPSSLARSLARMPEAPAPVLTTDALGLRTAAAGRQEEVEVEQGVRNGPVEPHPDHVRLEGRLVRGPPRRSSTCPLRPRPAIGVRIAGRPSAGQSAIASGSVERNSDP